MPPPPDGSGQDPAQPAADLHIVSPTEDDLPIAQAARVAGVSVGALRRAVQTGQVPRRYAAAPKGPRLVFWRPDLERWRAWREAMGPRTAEQRSLSAHRLRHRGSVDEGEMLRALEDYLADLDAHRAEITAVIDTLREGQG